MHLVLPLFSSLSANLFINYYHKHPDSHAAGKDLYKKVSLMRLDERGMRAYACASSPMPRHYTIWERHFVGVLLEFHIIEHQGVSGWLTYCECECIFSRRLTRSWLDAENNSCTWHHLKYTNLRLHEVRSAWRESYIRVTFMVCLAREG